MRNERLLLWLFLFVLLFQGAYIPPKSAEDALPNVLLFIADDMFWRDCEPYGNMDVKTPNLSRLAKEGMRFNNMFTGTAMCAPSRQQLYTGLFPIRNGAYPNKSWVYDGVRSIPHHFQPLGYHTSVIGKTHFGPKASFPFDHINTADLEGDTYKDIEEIMNKDASNPFFMIVASRQPHIPWNKGDASAYEPASFRVPPYLVDTEETREGLSRYFAEITYLDDQLGRCLELLKKSGKEKNTIVIFTSEQGAAFPYGKWTCYDNGLRTGFLIRWPGKIAPSTQTEVLAQYVDVVPTLLEAIGQKPKRIDTGIADGNGNRGFDGESFLKVLLQNKKVHRDYVYGVHTTNGISNGNESYPIRSVRSDEYLYIRNLNYKEDFSNNLTKDPVKGAILSSWLKGDGPAISRGHFYSERPFEELYHVRRDRYNLRNLAGYEIYNKVKVKMRKELELFMAQQGDNGEVLEKNGKKRQSRFLNKQPEKNKKVEFEYKGE